MKIDLNIKQSEETKDNSVQLQKDDETVFQPGNMPFSQMLQSFNVKENDSADGISALPDIDLNFDTMSMNIEDAQFFINLAENSEYISIPSQEGEFKLIKTEIVQNTVTAKTTEVTNQLTELIQKAQNTQKPVRISFDNDVSVVLRIDKNGKVTAEFIPGTPEVENYLKNNIAGLRQKFDEQNLPYNDIFYRNGNKQRGNRNKKGNKGE